MLSTCRTVGHPIAYQPLQTVGRGVVEFADGVRIGVFPSQRYLSTYSYIEARASSARVSVGSDSWINNDFCAIAEHTSITIGKRVLIGTGVEVFDSDFHGIHLADRAGSGAQWAKAVVIEDDVFIGSNVRVLKGVTIGRGSVIAGSSVVTKDVPAGVVAGGNPASVIRAI